MRQETSNCPTTYVPFLCLDVSDNFQGPYLRVRKEPLGKVGTETSADSLGSTGSELTLIPGVLNDHGGQPVRVGAYGDQMTNRILAQIPLSVGPVDLQSHHVVILLWNPHRFSDMCNDYFYGGRVQVEAILLICIADPDGDSRPTKASFY